MHRLLGLVELCLDWLQKIGIQVVLENSIRSSSQRASYPQRIWVVAQIAVRRISDSSASACCTAVSVRVPTRHSRGDPSTERDQ
jgi:hypothetical protein